MERIVYIARHGETELNRLKVVQGSGVDPGLNEFGVAQSEALAAAVGDALDLAVTSGMARAVETAAPFVAAGVPVVHDDRFREIAWGIHEGKAAEPWMRDEYAKLMAAWEAGELDASLTDGESARELGSRLAAAWQDFTGRAFAKAAIVMHGRALRALVCLIDGEPLSHMNDYPHANGGYYAAAERADGTWELRERNQTGHLEGVAPQNASA